VERRGLTLATVKRFNLGLSIENGAKWITIPHYRNGQLVNIKFRSVPPAPKDFKRVAKCRSVLFNGDCLKGRKEIFITEGELDAMTLIQEGIENVVGSTTGAGSFDPEWIDQLKNAEKVFIVYDSDESGQKGARSLAKRLGYSGCFNIELPKGQDVNDFFNNGHKVSDFRGLVKAARRFDLPGIVPVDKALEFLAVEMLGRPDDYAVLTPWKEVNRLIRGFYPGDLIVLSAPPKVGKTTFALQISWDLSFQGYPALFYCLEMRPERLVKKVVQGKYRLEEPTLDDIERAAREFAGLPLYLGHSSKKQKLDEVLDLIREAVKRYDLRFVVLDNVHFLIRTISNMNEELGQAVQGFKLLAGEMEIPILLIAQPRKRGVGERDEIMRAEDVKYSNAVHADCDQMIILYRRRVASKAKEIGQDEFTAKSEALDPVTLIRVEADRYGTGGETVLYYRGEQSRYDPITKRKERRRSV